MRAEELREEITMNYDELVQHLLSKYGGPSMTIFALKLANLRTKRTAEETKAYFAIILTKIRAATYQHPLQHNPNRFLGKRQTGWYIVTI